MVRAVKERRTRWPLGVTRHTLYNTAVSSVLIIVLLGDLIVSEDIVRSCLSMVVIKVE